MQTSSHQPRLHRLRRTFAHSPLYFVTLCTHGRVPLLATDDVHVAFVDFTCRGDSYGVYVGRFVIMPDHAHIFLSIAEGSTTLSAWMKSLKNALSKIFRQQGHSSPHWQKGFFDHVMRSADSYSEKWDYVRSNPVRAGLVATPDAWPYQGTIHDLRF
jgi:putative transposase